MAIFLSLGRQTIGCQGARCLEVQHFRGLLLELKDTGCRGPLPDPVEKQPKSFVVPIELSNFLVGIAYWSLRNRGAFSSLVE